MSDDEKCVVVKKDQRDEDLPIVQAQPVTSKDPSDGDLENPTDFEGWHEEEEARPTTYAHSPRYNAFFHNPTLDEPFPYGGMRYERDDSMPINRPRSTTWYEYDYESRYYDRPSYSPYRDASPSRSSPSEPPRGIWRQRLSTDGGREPEGDLQRSYAFTQSFHVDHPPPPPPPPTAATTRESPSSPSSFTSRRDYSPKPPAWTDHRGIPVDFPFPSQYYEPQTPARSNATSFENARSVRGSQGMGERFEGTWDFYGRAGPRNKEHSPKSSPPASSNTPPSKKASPKKVEYVYKIFDEDVICGRGVPNTTHPGNVAFRDVIQHYQVEYIAAKRADKPKIAGIIMDMMETKGGRFLKRVRTPDEELARHAEHYTWVEIGRHRAYEKCCQALRDGAPTIRQRMLAMNTEKKTSTTGQGKSEDVSIPIGRGSKISNSGTDKENTRNTAGPASGRTSRRSQTVFASDQGASK